MFSFRHCLSMFYGCVTMQRLPPPFFFSQMENSPLVRRFRMKFRNTTISRMPKAIAQLIGWLVKVQYS